MSMMRRNASGVVSPSGVPPDTPAFAKTTSRRPKERTAVATAFSNAATSVIACNSGGCRPEFRDRPVERFLLAAGDDHLRALGHKAFGRGQSDAAIASRDQGDLALKSHDSVL
jgi:hypothetical protein